MSEVEVTDERAAVAEVGSGVEVVRATSVAVLADHLAERLRSAPPEDPFASIEVAVPSRGLERWLTQRLSGVLGATPEEAGVAANLDFPFIGGTIQRIVAAAVGDPPGAGDPWAPDRLAWPLLSLLDQLPDAPELAPLRAHLTDGAGPVPRRRFPLARRIADLFDRYALYRPDMVAAWRDGAAVDGEGGPLAANLAWQPVLWRRLEAQVTAESPDLRLARAIERLRSTDPLPGALPTAVSVFGVLAVPPRHLDLLVALADRVPVTLYVVTPCPAWPVGEPRPVPANPLLVASGARARDAHTVLQPLLAGSDVLDAADAGADGEGVGASGARTALQVLQADVRADRRRGGTAPLPSVRIDPGDRSVQVHTCHGLVRQLEVLREVLLGLLEDDPDLEPRDIIVLTPDVAAVAPLLPAAFPARRSDGTTSATGPEDLPVRVADRSLGETSAVAGALLTVLELTTGRAGASAVLDLLASVPVRARFGLTAADLERLPGWLAGSGISWGRDADHRAALIGLDDDAHTWRAGLDRWTLGAAMADDGTRLVAGVRPFDEVEGDGVELLGRVAAATDALFACLDDLADARPIGAWRDALTTVLERLLDPGPGPARSAELTDDLASVRRAVEEVVAAATDTDGVSSGVALTLEELRGLLAEHLGAASGRPATGTGAITVTGMVPLRNLPHRVVCLVGMDDGALPRAGSPLGFDLLEVPRRPGDPDPRLEDRQLLLDAILAAGDHLIITATGHDPRTNEERQPAVPISELLDVLEASIDDPAQLRTAHPLQPHSPRYFRAALPGESAVPRAFDPAHLAAARAAQHASGPAATFVTGPLPSPPVDLVDLDAIELDDLVRFVAHPVRFLLQRRLGLSLGRDDPRLEDRDPTELDSLQRWSLGQALLEHHLAGRPVDRWREVTLAARTTPVGGLGSVALDGVEELVRSLLTQVDQLAGPERVAPVEVVVPLDPADTGAATARIRGAVTLRGDATLEVTVSKIGAKQRLAAWIRVLAVAASEPTLRPSAVLLGRHKQDRARAAPPVRLDPAAAEVEALDELGWLVELYLRGHRELLPLLPATCEAYTKARVAGKDHDGAIATAQTKAWQQFDPTFSDGADAYVVQALGPDTDLADVARQHPFAAEAMRLWGPVLAAEVGA
ncbi:MAG: exodeoxyribonuclease V subunit gamma [Nitriliruptoraceae bacterium]